MKHITIHKFKPYQLLDSQLPKEGADDSQSKRSWSHPNGEGDEPSKENLELLVGKFWNILIIRGLLINVLNW